MEDPGLALAIKEEMGLSLRSGASLEEIRASLAAHINDLINTDFNQLVSLLYRIDVSENKLKYLLAQQAGHDVVFFARGKHLAALKQNGLTLRSPHGAAQLRVQVFERPAEAGAPVDVVMFAVKLWDTESAAELLRPVVGYANYRTPIRNLYLCGSAAHPGGGVMGIAGANAAREMLKWM